MNRTTEDRGGRVRRTAVTVVALIALDAAAISYHHALQVVRLVGNAGNWAYLPPLLPDGLIYLSAVALYEAARAQAPRPRWAVVGLVLGCLVTIAMNVAAGWPHGTGGALVAALAPVVLFLALEILTGVLRRGRGGGFPERTAAAAAARPALSLDEAIRAAAPFMSQRELAEAFSVSKTTVARRIGAGTTAAAANGSGPHE